MLSDHACTIHRKLVRFTQSPVTRGVNNLNLTGIGTCRLQSQFRTDSYTCLVGMSHLWLTSKDLTLNQASIHTGNWSKFGLRVLKTTSNTGSERAQSQTLKSWSSEARKTVTHLHRLTSLTLNSTRFQRLETCQARTPSTNERSSARTEKCMPMGTRMKWLTSTQLRSALGSRNAPEQRFY